MKYEELIETISTLVENEKVYKKGLTLIYELPDNDHRKMNEALFYKSNPASAKFENNAEFEVELGGILVKFVRHKLETPEE